MSAEIADFPWCNISSQEFTRVGLWAKDIQDSDVDNILQKDKNIYLGSFTPMPLNPQHITALEMDHTTVGFSYCGLFSTDKAYAEMAFVHIRNTFRGFGFGSVLHDLTLQRLLTHSFDVLIVHINDQTGKIEGLSKDQGMVRSEKSVYLSKDPQWEMSLEDDESKKNLSGVLERRLRRHLATFKDGQAQGWKSLMNKYSWDDKLDYYKIWHSEEALLEKLRSSGVRSDYKMWYTNHKYR